MLRGICCLLAVISLASSESRRADPFRVFVFTRPHGAEAAKARMHEAVADVEEVVELSEWLELADGLEAAEIVIDIRAYALAEDTSAHYIYADVEILGEPLLLVGADVHEQASRKRAVSDLMEKLQDYCADHFAELDAKRRAPPVP